MRGLYVTCAGACYCHGVDATNLVSKLQGEAAHSLAALSVEVLLQRPVEAFVPEALARETARKALSAWLASDTAPAVLERVVEALVNELQQERRSLKELTSKDVRHALHELLRRPFSPDRRLVLTVIDREPMREVVRALLLQTVLEFGRKASAPVAGVAKGLGSLAKLAGETVKSRSGSLGSLVGAVSGEVERQVEKRAVEFVDAALGGVFAQLADVVSDPKRAEEAAELRVAFFDGVLELTGTQLAREVMNLDVTGGAAELREGLKRWLASTESDAELTRAATLVLSRDAKRPVKDVLQELGLLEVTREVATKQLAGHIQHIAAAPEFASWLSAL